VVRITDNGVIGRMTTAEVKDMMAHPLTFMTHKFNSTDAWAESTHWKQTMGNWITTYTTVN